MEICTVLRLIYCKEDYIEKKASSLGLQMLFLLTTRTANWQLSGRLRADLLTQAPRKIAMLDTALFLALLLSGQPSAALELLKEAVPKLILDLMNVEKLTRKNVASQLQGFDSVMVDGSEFPFKENISYTKFISSLAHAKGMIVEAELGRLSRTEDDLTVENYEATMTDIKQLKPRMYPQRTRRPFS